MTCSKEEKKETVQILENEFFKDEKHMKDFSIDWLCQMTPILNNSLFSQKEKNFQEW